jgi:hypothetical protein
VEEEVGKLYEKLVRRGRVWPARKSYEIGEKGRKVR